MVLLQRSLHSFHNFNSVRSDLGSGGFILIMKEDSIQQKIFLWFSNNYCLKFHNPRFVIFHVPNGGKRSKTEGIYFKKIGLLAGVSDLIILTDKETIFIEVKNEFGTQSYKQKDFQNRVEALGFNYILVRSLEEFQKKIKKLL